MLVENYRRYISAQERIFTDVCMVGVQTCPPPLDKLLQNRGRIWLSNLLLKSALTIGLHGFSLTGPHHDVKKKKRGEVYWNIAWVEVNPNLRITVLKFEWSFCFLLKLKIKNPRVAPINNIIEEKQQRLIFQFWVHQCISIIFKKCKKKQQQQQKTAALAL